MKPHALTATLLIALTTLAARGQAVATAPATVNSRIIIPLNDAWRFHKGDRADAEAASAATADADWEAVTIPHTWNAKDGQDGGNDYYKGDCWYRRHITVDGTMKGKLLYLRFEAINRNADIYVNGTLLGSHAGGQATICLDATKALHPGDNLLAVKVSNRVDLDMPPLQADFTFYGGIYRPAQLIAVKNVHIRLDDFASPGVYVTTPRTEKGETIVNVKFSVQNDSTTPANVRFQARVRDASGKIASSAQGYNATLKPGERQNAELEIGVPDPHLWNGRLDPYLYSVDADVSDNGDQSEFVLLDSVSQPLGIRTTSVDPVKGFLLNGKPYDLHGVNRHQDRIDKGWAISEADHLQDMALIKEMGCTAIRLAHYQHSQFFYDLCDKEGMVVWAEVPVVDRLGAGQAFTDNAKQQYTELIRQNFNHPSIAFWSAGNEVDESGTNFNRNGPPVYPWFKDMSALGHKEDPSRPTASAWREKFFPPAGTTDAIGLNEYLGWYTGGGRANNSGWEGLETYIADHSDPAKGGIKGMWAMTEYGAGSSIYFHAEKPVRMDHTEEYEALLHENTWKVFKQHPEIWGKFVWNMFDFASDGRTEGDHAGINDKGLVTYDRLTKKDAFFYYKAVWSDEPFVYLTSRRFAVRGLEKIPVKVYTNAAKATLYINGTALPEKAADNGTIVWDAVTLKDGKNETRVTATAADGKKLEDTCIWTYTPGAPAAVYEAQDQRMRQAGPPRTR